MPLDPEPEWIGFARSKGVQALIERDPHKAVEGADLVVTDTWVSMHDPESAKERRHNQLRGYQVNSQMMALTGLIWEANIWVVWASYVLLYVAVVLTFSSMMQYLKAAWGDLTSSRS